MRLFPEFEYPAWVTGKIKQLPMYATAAAEPWTLQA